MTEVKFPGPRTTHSEEGFMVKELPPSKENGHLVQWACGVFKPPGQVLEHAAAADRNPLLLLD